jgi:hypothetical protein
VSTDPATPPATPATPHAWGKLLDKWHDEVGPFHLLRPDGSPSCGASYFTSSGPYPYPEQDCYPRCDRCRVIAQKTGVATAPPRGALHEPRGGGQ